MCSSSRWDSLRCHQDSHHRDDKIRKFKQNNTRLQRFWKAAQSAGASRLCLWGRNRSNVFGQEACSTSMHFRVWTSRCNQGPLLLPQDWIIFFCVSKTYLLKIREIVTGWAESFLLLSSSLVISPFPPLDFFLEAAVSSILVSGFSPSVKEQEHTGLTHSTSHFIELEKMSRQVYIRNQTKKRRKYIKCIREVTLLRKTPGIW